MTRHDMIWKIGGHTLWMSNWWSIRLSQVCAVAIIVGGGLALRSGDLGGVANICTGLWMLTACSDLKHLHSFLTELKRMAR